MSQFYFDPSHEADKWLLPDGEAFYAPRGEWGVRVADGETCDYDPNGDHEAVQSNEEGWYWWSCLPGCLPDCGPNGPFETEDEAISNAREMLCDS